MFVMICYDVPAKRTEIYKKLLKEYLLHEQASVFMGDLPEAQLIKLIDRDLQDDRAGRQDTKARCQESAQRRDTPTRKR